MRVAWTRFVCKEHAVKFMGPNFVLEKIIAYASLAVRKTEVDYLHKERKTWEHFCRIRKGHAALIELYSSNSDC